MIKNNHILIIALVIALIIVTYIAYLTPMHSDDFSYYNMGLGWQTHLDHYNSWSGRFLADYISPLLLMSPKIISSIIIAFTVITMIFITSILPALTLKQDYSAKSFVILFAVYWLGNPTLGQTLFWIVGAANYLFTNLVIILYLLCFILYAQKPTSTSKFISLLIMSALVGFSSENTTWIALLFSLISSLYLFKKNNDKKIFLSLFLVSISFYFMVFSPGNMARASSPDFMEFYNISFIERVINFIMYRLPTALVRLLPIIVPMLFLFFIAYKNNLTKNQNIAFYVCCLISLLSLSSMVMSPTLTYRSLSGPFLFLLLGCGILLQFIFMHSKLQLSKLLNVLCIVLGSFFIASYTLIAYSYSKLHAQEKIILSEIQTSKKDLNDTLRLPEYYYIPSLKDRDSHDSYTNAPAMSEYHKTKKIELIKVHFDFSAIYSETIPTLNNDLFTKISFSPLGLVGIQGSNIIFESNQLLDDSEDNLIIKITTRKNDIETISIPLKSILLDQKHLIGLTTKYQENEIHTVHYSTSKNGQEINNFKLIFQSE